MDDAIIRAGHDCIVRNGVRRSTMAGIARAAHVSRPTLYRRYKDVTALATTLLTRELLQILESVPRMPATMSDLVSAIVTYTDAARTNDFLRAIIESDPELLTTYSFRRFGQSQITLIRYLETLIKHIQASDLAASEVDGQEQPVEAIRQDDPHVMATMILVITQAAALSATAAESGLGSTEVWREELTRTLKGYLAQ